MSKRNKPSNVKEEKKSPIIKEDIRFVSTFKHFDDEESGIKPYTIRCWHKMPQKKYDKIMRFQDGKNELTVTISRGYTSKCIRHKVKHICYWRYGDIILSWDAFEESLPPYQRKRSKDEKEMTKLIGNMTKDMSKSLYFVRHIEEHLKKKDAVKMMRDARLKLFNKFWWAKSQEDFDNGQYWTIQPRRVI